jgi:hypothetical protein
MDKNPYSIEFIVSSIKEVIRRRGETNALMDLLGEKPNPFKGMCYVATMVLYEIFEGKGMSLYKKKDYKGEYHWWIKMDDGRTIDITAEQYTIEGKEVPSSSYNGAILSKPMWFPSYKKRILVLKNELLLLISQ